LTAQDSKTIGRSSLFGSKKCEKSKISETSFRTAFSACYETTGTPN